MKNNLLWAFTVLVILGAVYFSFGQVMIYKSAELQFRQEQFNFEKLKLQKELAMSCQEMSAVTTNPKWEYKNCLNELTGISPTFQN